MSATDNLSPQQFSAQSRDRQAAQSWLRGIVGTQPLDHPVEHVMRPPPTRRVARA